MTDSDSELRDLVRDGDRDRYLSIQFAPPAARPGLLAVAAFAAEIAAIPGKVSEPVMGQMRVAWWRDALDRIEARDPPHHPVALALAAAWRPALGERLAAILDASNREFAGEPSMGALDGAAQVAWLPLLGADGAAAEAAAWEVGRAWGLLRDDAAADAEPAVNLARARKRLPEVPRSAMPAMLIGAVAASM
ncbi:MAG: squalene/phytoene synthase family protein, partial [Proteobacteria bacterium]|nr:squalene/phytoene synthase family protein [Pseudomonadota bacterium]